jgi:hypothetical protein
MIRDPETGELTIALTPSQLVAVVAVVLAVISIAARRRKHR